MSGGLDALAEALAGRYVIVHELGHGGMASVYQARAPGRAEPVARQLFPLAERVDDEPWMGARPCTADMLPIIGPAPRHRNLWFAFGHAHQGFTLGAVTGRLIAEMLSGETPFVDPMPYRADRFA